MLNEECVFVRSSRAVNAFTVMSKSFSVLTMAASSGMINTALTHLVPGVCIDILRAGAQEKRPPGGHLGRVLF